MQSVRLLVGVLGAVLFGCSNGGGGVATNEDGGPSTDSNGSESEPPNSEPEPQPAGGGAGGGASTPPETGGRGGSPSGGGAVGAEPPTTTTGGVGTSEGGRSSAGGAPSDGAGAGGRPSTALSAAEACIAYANAACRRQVECLSDQDPVTTCSTISESCPDLLFSDGTTRSVAEIAACVEQWVTFDCNALSAGQLPACVLPGTRLDGTTCMFPSQCAGTCSRPTNGCGECVPDEAAEPVETALLEEGEPCDESAQCATRYCGFLSDEEGNPVGDAPTCRGLPLPGESCAQTLECVTSFSISYCEASDLLCHPGPAPGEPCGTQANSGDRVCAPPLVCIEGLGAEAVCDSLPDIGEPCIEGMVSLACVAGATCDLDTRLCREPVSEEETSVTPLPNPDEPVPTPDTAPNPDATPPPFANEDSCGECPDGQQCLCLTGACSRRQCGVRVGVGEACDQAGALCHPASSCTNGVCLPLESQGLFELWCGTSTE